MVGERFGSVGVGIIFEAVDGLAEGVEIIVEFVGVERAVVGVSVGGGRGEILGDLLFVGEIAWAGAIKVDVAGLAVDEEAESGGEAGDEDGAQAEDEEVAGAGVHRELLRSRTARYWSSARPSSSRAASWRMERAERVAMSWS